jgi:hypothetical protein
MKNRTENQLGYKVSEEKDRASASASGFVKNRIENQLGHLQYEDSYVA